MSAEGSVTVFFLIVLLLMLGAAYSYYLLGQGTSKVEERQKPRAVRKADQDGSV